MVTRLNVPRRNNGGTAALRTREARVATKIRRGTVCDQKTVAVPGEIIIVVFYRGRDRVSVGWNNLFPSIS